MQLRKLSVIVESDVSYKLCVTETNLKSIPNTFYFQNLTLNLEQYRKYIFLI